MLQCSVLKPSPNPSTIFPFSPILFRQLSSRRFARFRLLSRFPDHYRFSQWDNNDHMNDKMPVGMKASVRHSSEACNYSTGNSGYMLVFVLLNQHADNLHERSLRV